MSTSNEILRNINSNVYYIMFAVVYLTVHMFFLGEDEAEKTNSYALYCPTSIEGGLIEYCNNAASVSVYVMQFKANYIRNEITSLISFDNKEAMGLRSSSINELFMVQKNCRILNVKNWECGLSSNPVSKMIDDKYFNEGDKAHYFYVSWVRYQFARALSYVL